MKSFLSRFLTPFAALSPGGLADRKNCSMPYRTIAILALLPLLASLLPAQNSSWTKKKARRGPEARYAAAMAEGPDSSVVLFGGYARAGSGILLVNDTWKWDGSKWHDVTPTISPPARHTAVMAYDSGRGVTVLFGGATGGSGENAQGDTWEWNGNTWTDVTPTGDSPVARYGQGMAYDGTSIVLFGGTTFQSAGSLADTWTWDGTVWDNVTPAGPNPPARSLVAMAYDSGNDRMVLFGGRNVDGFVDETWTWNGSIWELAATNPELVRGRTWMVYDERCGCVVMFGGMHENGTLLGDSWKWDGSSWTALTFATGKKVKKPSARLYHMMAYDSVNERTLLFGGRTGWGAYQNIFGDTWLLEVH